MRRRYPQRGVALITAMLVVAVATVAAVAIASRQYLDVRRTANVIDLDRAYLFALGAETWASQVLARDDAAIDHLGEDWALVLPPLTVEGAELAGKIEDLQGRFNLNNLLKDGKPSPIDVERFKRLLTTVGLDPLLAVAVLDWLDADAEPQFPNGVEDVEYLNLQLPYRAANRLMASPSELLAVKGFTADSYAKLSPFVSALPGRSDININTAPQEVMMALGDGITAADAEALIEQRKNQEFARVDDFLVHPALAGRNIVKDGLSVSSRYFMVEAEARFGRSQLRLYSMLQRQNNSVRPIMRAQGIY